MFARVFARSFSTALRTTRVAAFRAPAMQLRSSVSFQMTRPAAMSVRFFSEDMESFNDMERESGTVKWFDSARGFGFIVRDNGEDLFVHFSSVQADGYRSLEEGQRVEYSIGQGRKGQIACDVVVE